MLPMIGLVACLAWVFPTSAFVTPMMSAVEMPPGKARGPFRGIRESIAYLKNPDEFIKERTEEFGPVFSTTIFFQPTIIVGGAENVAEFLKVERTVISESSLPETFNELHTEDGLLCQDGAKHAATRAAIAPTMDRSAQRIYLPVIQRRTEAMVQKMLAAGTVPIAKELKTEYLNLFAELFHGSSLSEAEVELFQDYNAGLLSLGRWARTWKKGKKALLKLQTIMKERLVSARKQGVPEPRFHAIARWLEAVDEHGQKWEDSRIATGMLLMVWGAYIETAALACSVLVYLGEYPAVLKQLRAELEDKEPGLGQYSNDYLTGVLRESLRLHPPAGGGYRKASADARVGNYTIPAGYIVSADPRIGNRDPTLYPDPEVFKPERWVSMKPVKGGWFPGGIGAHQCPGVPLAELAVRVFVVEWLKAVGEWEPASELKEVLIPIKIPDDNFMMKLTGAEGK